MRVIIGFSRAKSNYKIMSTLIRWYLQTDYSHVYLKFNSKSTDRDIIYEAVGKGVRFIGSRLWSEHSIVCKEYEIEISDCNYKRLMQFCIDYAGINYGILQNAGLVIAKIFRLKKNPFKKWINCSELIAYVLELEGYKVTINKDLITPRDIEDLLKDGLDKSL